VVAYEALHEGTIAGFYGMIPQRFRVGDSLLRFYQSMDTMTHPDYQRRGLFVRLAEATYQQIEATEGALHAIGIPGPTSYPGFVGKLGWVAPHHFRQLMAPSAVLLVRGALGPRVRLHTVDWQRPKPLQQVLDHLPQLRPVAPYWDVPTLHWRLARHPLTQYRVQWVELAGRPVGWVVSRSIRGRCFVEWLELTDTALYSQLVPALLRAMVRDWNAAWLFTWEPSVAVQAAALRSAGLFANPLGRGPLKDRIPLILRHSPQGAFADMDLSDASLYALQPLVQD
jgi:hypothetical protein